MHARIEPVMTVSIVPFQLFTVIWLSWKLKKLDYP